MHRTEYVLKRIAFALMTVLVAITLNFLLFHALPGSAVTSALRGSPHSSPELKAALVHEFGLDQSLWQQYVLYLKQLFLHGNMGSSFIDPQPVTSTLARALGNTIPLVFVGTFVAIAIGIVTGFLAAWRRSGTVDFVSTNTAIVFYALPTQFIGMMLILLFAKYLPTSQMHSALDYFSDQSRWASFVDSARHMVLPALCLALTLFGEYTLVVRSSMLETLGEDYVLTARAKGLPQRRIVVGHALRNAMLPIATLVALSLGYIVAGAILVEIVFTWPGIGSVVYSAVSHRDYPMLQGAFLILTLSVVFFNFVADLVYFKLDPRIAE
jgi:ABC-type dipeptide/oligopeptide/nickel transport system permease component